METPQEKLDRLNRARSGRLMAQAVWDDLGRFDRIRQTSHGPAFAYQSRVISVDADSAEDGSVASVRLSVVEGPDLYTTGSASTGREAMELLLIGIDGSGGLLGELCADGYRTGLDSCPGCISFDERFENEHPNVLPVPGDDGRIKNSRFRARFQDNRSMVQASWGSADCDAALVEFEGSDRIVAETIDDEDGGWVRIGSSRRQPWQDMNLTEAGARGLYRELGRLISQRDEKSH